MASRVEKKTVEELNKMHTGSLMSRRAALLKCEESFKLSDQIGYESQPAPHADFIEFKNTPEWRQAYDELKAELATREHIPNKQERKEIRKQRAKNKNR